MSAPNFYLWHWCSAQSAAEVRGNRDALFAMFNTFDYDPKPLLDEACAQVSRERKRIRRALRRH